MDEFKLDRSWLKDMAILLPLLGIVLAVTYDVGFFYGVGIEYFTLFSLQEHILFALQITPIALAVALTLPSGIAAYRAGRNAAERDTPPIPTGKVEPAELLAIREKVQAYFRRSQRSLFWFSLLFLALGILATATHQYFGGAIAITSGVGGLLGYQLKGSSVPTIYFALWYLVLYIIASFALGMQMAWGALHSEKPRQVITTASAGPLSATLIRSGDRGMMVFDPVTRGVRFVLWNDVKGFQSANQK
jgi:hypothetical protein